jgi:hypothetical protein
MQRVASDHEACKAFAVKLLSTLFIDSLMIFPIAEGLFFSPDFRTCFVFK